MNQVHVTPSTVQFLSLVTDKYSQSDASTSAPPGGPLLERQTNRAQVIFTNTSGDPFSQFALLPKDMSLGTRPYVPVLRATPRMPLRSIISRIKKIFTALVHIWQADNLAPTMHTTATTLYPCSTLCSNIWIYSTRVFSPTLQNSLGIRGSPCSGQTRQDAVTEP
eukprot:gene23419-30694_t